MKTRPRTTKRGRQHVGSLTRTLAWEWVKVNHPDTAEKIKAVAYVECGLKPPQPRNSPDAEMQKMLKKI